MTDHRWDRDNERRMAACECVDGNSRTMKVCEKCKKIKITILTPNGARNEWRTPDGKTVYSSEPRCIGGRPPAEVTA